MDATISLPLKTATQEYSHYWLVAKVGVVVVISWADLSQEILLPVIIKVK